MSSQPIPTDQGTPRRAATNGATPLLNARHEAFCRALARGATADEAYVSAGYAANRGNACTLKAKESIKKRVAHLQTQMAAKTVEKATITKDWVLNRAVKLHETVSSHITDETGAFNGSAANVASRTLGQIGDHVDVQAWKQPDGVHLHITVDQAIGRLAALDDVAIEGAYEDVTDA